MPDSSSYSVPAAICTSFWGDFHFGLAGLVNSLVRHGFAGSLYAGYAGPLPPWCPVKPDSSGEATMQAGPVQIHFLPLPELPPSNFAKPRFMQEVWDRAGSPGLYFLDSDILVATWWLRFEQWLKFGLALVEDIASPRFENDPLRAALREEVMKPAGYHCRFRMEQYINSGCVGITEETVGILSDWQRVCTIARPICERLKKPRRPEKARSPKDDLLWRALQIEEQDVLNAVLEARPDIPVSLMRQAAMAFVPGGEMMQHAIGPWKPWNRNPCREALQGLPARKFDFRYWKFMKKGPIHPFRPGHIFMKLLELRLSLLMSRAVPRQPWFQ